MKVNKSEVPIGEIVAERLGRSRVFEKYDLDYCCGGQTPLNEACREKGIDPEEVLNALSVSDAEAQYCHVAPISQEEQQ